MYFRDSNGIRTHGLYVNAAVLYHGCLNCNHHCDDPIFIQKKLTLQNRQKFGSTYI